MQCPGDHVGGGADSSSLAPLRKWLRSVDIWWDECLVEIRSDCSNCSGPGLGVYAVKDITENQLLCVIPRASILSPRTTQLAAVLERERLGGGLGLTIAVMFEASLGERSRWAGYFASLPAREYLPMFWSDEELALLQGTSLQGTAQDDRQHTAEDYEEHVAPLLHKYPQLFPQPELCSLEHFRTAASLVASRSFFVDDWHGDALVPLADIFNHKASVVLLHDAWGVAELADTQRGHHSDDSSHGHHDSSDADEEGELDAHAPGRSSSEEQEAGSEDSDDAGLGQGGSDEEEAEEEAEEEDEEGQEEDQHGHAVGGMPMIAAGPASCPGDSSRATRWLRDGINLRLEIGICSFGPPDSRSLPCSGAAAVGDAPTAHQAAAMEPPASLKGAATAAAAEGSAQDQVTAAAVGPDRTKRRKLAAAEAAAEAAGAVAQQQGVGNGLQHTRQPEQQQDGVPEGTFKQQQQQQQQWPEKRLEIIAASCVSAGAEVHNTYGELSNALLVRKYGFCLTHNPFDEVQLGSSWSGFIGGADTTSGFKPPVKLKQHVKWLQRYSNTLDDAAAGDEEDAAEPPTIAPGGRLMRSTAAVVRLLGASSAQLSTWQCLEDVLAEPDSDSEDAPAAVALDCTAAPHAAVAATGGAANGGTATEQAAAAAAAEAAGRVAEDPCISRHFQDMQLSQHSLCWWGKAGLLLLLDAVHRRLQQYPDSFEADQEALQQQRQQWCQGHGGGDVADGAGPGDHAAAVVAALQLRVCEQAALQQVADDVCKLLGEAA